MCLGYRRGHAPGTYDFNVLTQQLKVSIIGPADVMDELDASDLTANVDLLSYSTQAGAVDSDTITFNYTPTISCSKYKHRLGGGRLPCCRAGRAQCSHDNCRSRSESVDGDNNWK